MGHRTGPREPALMARGPSAPVPTAEPPTPISPEPTVEVPHRPISPEPKP